MKWTLRVAAGCLLAANATTGLAQGSSPTRAAPSQAGSLPDTLRANSGEQVRFLASSVALGQQYAKFIAFDGTSLIVEQRNSEIAKLAIPLDRLENLEVRRGRGKSRTHQGAAIGMIVGAALFAGGGYWASGGSENEFAGLGAALLAPVGVGVGALVGGLIGSQAGGFHWMAAHIPASDPGSRR